jgi:hypothetical protein
MPKKKPELEIPIQGLNLADPLGMSTVMERIFAAPRLIHIHGAPSVGKTAFCFKIVCDMLDQKPEARILWMYFDEEIDY